MNSIIKYKDLVYPSPTYTNNTGIIYDNNSTSTWIKSPEYKKNVEELKTLPEKIDLFFNLFKVDNFSYGLPLKFYESLNYDLVKLLCKILEKKVDNFFFYTTYMSKANYNNINYNNFKIKYDYSSNTTFSIGA